MLYSTSAAFHGAGTARGQDAYSQVWEALKVFSQLEDGTLYSQCPRIVGSGVFKRQGQPTIRMTSSCMARLCVGPSLAAGHRVGPL